jgi:hypothetical protein
MAYDFQPRIPVDHVIQLSGIFLGTVERERGDVLILCGSTLGEAGALLKQGLVVTNAVEVDADADIEVMAEQLQAMVEADPQFNIAPWIPVILKIIEMILARRG